VLGEPHGPVHFIGSDVSLKFPGYIEGALETAERAVADIVAAPAGRIGVLTPPR
jgi:monoamine oxidase